MNILKIVDQHRRTDAAKKLLDDILHKKKIKRSIIEKLYGREYADIILQTINEFYTVTDLKINSVRKINTDAKQYIHEAIHSAQLDCDFQAIQHALINLEAPSMDLIIKNFGEKYGRNVYDTLVLFNEHKILRKSHLSYAADHLLPVGFGAKRLAEKFTKDVHEQHKLGAEGCLHDTLENLLNIIKDIDGTIKYGVEKYDEFMVEKIHSELRHNVDLVTNHSGLILREASNFFKKKNIDPSIEQIKKYLIDIQEKVPISMQGCMVEMIATLESEDPLIQKQLKKHAMYGLRDIVYHDVFIPRGFEMCIENKDFKPMYLKSVDLVHNGSTLTEIPFDSRIRNILKRAIFAYLGRLANTEFAKENSRDTFLDSLLEEVEQHALKDAHALIGKKFAEEENIQSNFYLGLSMIKQLEFILYTNVTRPKPAYPKEFMNNNI